jgi:uncharacterized repeat protein (TIGR04052 family)
MTARVRPAVAFLFAVAIASASARMPPHVGERALSVEFAAVAGAIEVRCGQPIPGVGTTKSEVRITDFRLFISRPRLVGGDGREVPMALEQDGLWQNGAVALVDFEDKQGECSNGTVETRRVLTGTAPDGHFAALRFELGLPFDVNHRDPTSQPSPLNLTRLFWNWNAGYKFARIDLRTSGQPRGWVLHLGSTGCTPNTGPNVVPVSCRFPNRPTITLAGFDPARHVVAFDLAELLRDSNVDVNQPETAAGCMSAQTDVDCGGLFGALGLPFGSKGAGGQRVFRMVPRETGAGGG